jgi:hypothetical protein
MALPLPHVVASEASASTPVRESSSFDDRWAAWQAKGAAHDRAARRKMALAAPILIVIIAVIAYLLVGR